MAYPVYTTRIYAGRVPGTNTHTRIATVPAGYRLVVKFLWVYQLSANFASFRLYTAPGGPELLRVFPGADTVEKLHQVHVVFHENEGVYGYARELQADVALYGFLLHGAGGPMTPGQLPAP